MNRWTSQRSDLQREINRLDMEVKALKYKAVQGHKEEPKVDPLDTFMVDNPFFSILSPKIAPQSDSNNQSAKAGRPGSNRRSRRNLLADASTP